MKVVRDPLYGDVFLSRNDVRLIDTEPVQRLRGASQLGALQWVYPRATHTRFEHSIGVLNLATRIARVILPKEEYEGIRDLLSAAAIFHDSGHPPFSHALEEHDIPLPSSEERSIRLARETSESMIDIDISGREVGNILAGKGAYLSEIVEGTLDADGLDSLRRDGLHTGVTYGLIAARITSLFARWHNHLAIDERAISPAEGVLFARYAMRSTIYDHEIAKSVEGMLAKAVMYAIKENDDNKDPISVEKLASLKDFELLSILKQHGKTPKEVVERLERRDLLVLAGVSDSKQLIEDGSFKKVVNMNGEQRLAWENELARKLHLKTFEVIIDKPKINEYFLKEGDIPIVSSNRKIGTLCLCSELAKQISENYRSLWAIRLYVPRRYRNTARKLFQEITEKS